MNENSLKITCYRTEYLQTTNATLNANANKDKVVFSCFHMRKDMIAPACDLPVKATLKLLFTQMS